MIILSLYFPPRASNLLWRKEKKMQHQKGKATFLRKSDESRLHVCRCRFMRFGRVGGMIFEVIFWKFYGGKWE